MQKNILITGASGFIGSFLVEEAIRRGYSVFAGMRASSNRQWLTDPKIQFVEMDLADRHQLEAALRKTADTAGRFEYVIHAAGLTKTLDSFAYTQVNFGGTQNLVEALQYTGLVPEKFVFISSLASYGPGAKDNRPIQASMQQCPVTAYGKSKLLAEQYLYRHADIPFLVINPTAVYGPRDKDFLFLVRSIQKGLELYIGNKKQLLSFVHVQDLVDAIYLATESDLLRQNLLVSDMHTYSSAEMNYLIKKILGRRTVPVVVPEWIAGIAATISEYTGAIRGKVPVLNQERFREFRARNWSVDAGELARLGFLPQFRLEEGLAHAIRWYLAQQWL